MLILFSAKIAQFNTKQRAYFESSYFGQFSKIDVYIKCFLGQNINKQSSIYKLDISLPSSQIIQPQRQLVFDNVRYVFFVINLVTQAVLSRSTSLLTITTVVFGVFLNVLQNISFLTSYI